MILLLALTLAACAPRGAQEDQLALQARDHYLALETFTGTMTLTADYGDRAYTYQGDFTWTPAGAYTLTLTAPPQVAGVTATVAQGETALHFDGTRLETGPLGLDGLSPLDGFPYLMTSLTQGYLAESAFEEGEGEEGKTLRLCCRDPQSTPGQGSEALLWLNPDTLALLGGEVRSQGTTIITCTIDTQQTPQPPSE